MHTTHRLHITHTQPASATHMFHDVLKVGPTTPQQGRSGFGDGLRSRAADAVGGGLRRLLLETAIATAARPPGFKLNGHRLHSIHSNIHMHTDTHTTHPIPTTSANRMRQNTGHTHRLYRTHIQTTSATLRSGRPRCIRLSKTQVRIGD